MTAATQSAAAIVRPLPSGDPLDHIPGEDGWPVVGKTLEVLRDPVGSTQAMYERYGRVFRSKVFGYRSLTLLGPEANELVLFDRDWNFSSSGGWGPILDRLFPRGLMLMDFDEHRLHRKALGVAFKPGPMKAYNLALNAGIARRIGEWHLSGDGQGRGAELKFYPAIKQLTLDLAATSFLGIDLGPQALELNRAFADMVAAAVAPIRSPIPGTQMWKGVKGRKVIADFFAREIPGRRGSDGSDLFTELCRATKEDDSLLTDQEVIDHMNFLMMAAHDTLTSSVSSLVWLLALNQDWQEKLRAEALSLKLPRGEPVPYEKLDSLELTEMAFKEAMRFNPPVPSIPRRAVRDFEFGGYQIPAGTRIAVNVIFTHRMPEIWPKPARFDPMRFTDEEVRKRHKFAWVPFSGGAHMCLGLHFAYMQAKAFFYHLLTTSKVTVAPGYKCDWQMWPIPRPKDGLPIRLERIG